MRFGRPLIAAAAAVAVSGASVTITAPRASAVGLVCVDRTFGPSNTYQPCVRDEQILLNDLWYDHDFLGHNSVNQVLATDGIYGPRTANDVAHFNWYEGLPGGSTTTSAAFNNTWGTWTGLCFQTWSDGFHGVYWHDAGCNGLTFG